MSTIDGNRKCGECGATLSPRCTGRLCPACLLDASWAAEADTVHPPVQCPGYTLLEEIGRGGSGSVWRAVTELGEIVAIKILVTGRLARDSERRQLLREAEITQRLNHSGIVRIRDVQDADGHLLLVMDHIEGETLAQRLRAGAIPADQIAGWIRDIADAIEHAHRRGVVHRDLKPGNILLTKEGMPRVVDFGLAALRDTNDSSSVNRYGLGTLGYLSPEQASGRHSEIGPTTDVHALGAILFHCATGRHPFVGNNVSAVLKSIVENEVDSPRGFDPTIPRDLETICLKCLEKSPRARYPSAAALRDDLDRFLERQPILARPLTALRRAGRWARRRPAAAALVAVVGMGTVLASWQWLRAESALRSNRRLLEVATVERSETAFRFHAGGDGLGVLARYIRENRNSDLAVPRLLSALTWRNWPLPLQSFGPVSNRVVSTAFTFDQTRIITIEASREIRFWNATNGLSVGESLFASGENFAYSIAGWSVAQVTNGWQSLRAYDGRRCDLNLPSNTISIALSPAGPVLAAVVDDRVELWDLETTRRVGEFPNATTNRSLHAKSPSHASSAFSADGMRLAAFLGDKVFVWDVSRGNKLVELSPGALTKSNVRFSDEGRAIILGGYSLVTGHTQVARFDVAEGREVWRWQKAGTPLRFGWDRSDRAVAVAFFADNEILDIRLGRSIRRTGGRQRMAGGNPFSRSGSRFLVTDMNKSLFVQDVADGARRSEELPMSYYLEHAEFSPGDDKVLFCDRTPYAYTGDIRPGAAAPYFFGDGPAIGGHSTDVEGNVVFTVVMGGAAQLWDIRKRRPLGPEIRSTNQIQRVAITPDGRHAATTDHLGNLVLWNPTNGRPVAGPFPLGSPASRIRFGPNGRILSGVTDRLEFFCRNGDTGAELYPPAPVVEAQQPGGSVTSLEFNRLGSRVVIGFEFGTVMFDVGTGRRIWYRPGSRTYSPIFSPDGKSVATCDSMVNQVWLLSADDGRPLSAPILLPGFALRLDFDSTGERLATSCEDGVARVYEVGRTVLKHAFSGHLDRTTVVRFSSDGGRLLTGSLDRTIRLWDVDTGLPTGEFMAGRPELPIGPPSVVEFVCADSRLLAFSGMSKGLSLWPAEQPPLPAPEWLTELALLLSGDERGDGATVQSNPILRLVELRYRLGRLAGDDFYSRWARWFFSDRVTRSPFPE